MTGCLLPSALFLLPFLSRIFWHTQGRNVEHCFIRGDAKDFVHLVIVKASDATYP
jgi:hypothetical protein